MSAPEDWVSGVPGGGEEERTRIFGLASLEEWGRPVVQTGGNAQGSPFVFSLARSKGVDKGVGF